MKCYFDYMSKEMRFMTNNWKRLKFKKEEEVSLDGSECGEAWPGGWSCSGSF